MKAKDLNYIDELLEKFVRCFDESGVLCDYEGELVRRQDTEASELDQLYAQLPAKFSPIYERLVLTYRWYQVEVSETLDLFANPPGPKLDGLQRELFKDKGLLETCLPNGYIQFGSGPDWYDPLCFDTSRPSHRTGGKDYAIVQLDHEEILCNYKIKVVRTIAASFEDLILSFISAS